MFKEKKCTLCGKIYSSSNQLLESATRWRISSDKSLYFNCECGSTLMIPPGNYEWYNPQEKLSPNAKNVFNYLINTGPLPFIPNSLMEFQRILHLPNSSLGDLALSLKEEPNMAARIMSLANARNIAGGSAINSIEHALAILGRNSLEALIIPSTLKNYSNRCKEYTPMLAYIESITCGLIAEQLVVFFPQAKLSADEAFLLGSLSCSLGKFLGSVFYPTEIDAIYKRSKNNENPCCWCVAERELAKTGHCVLGEIAVAIWGLPTYLLYSVSAHHRYEPRMAPNTTENWRNMLAGISVQFMYDILGFKERCDKDTLQNFVFAANFFDEKVHVFENQIKPNVSRSVDLLVKRGF